MKSILKKQYVGIISAFLFILLGAFSMYGQSYPQSMLINKEWVIRIPGKSFYSINLYTDGEVITKMFVDGVMADTVLKKPYYLSDVIVDKFEPDFVANSKSGKYIVVLHKDKDGKESVMLLEILELTDIYLKTKHLENGGIAEYRVENEEVK